MWNIVSVLIGVLATYYFMIRRARSQKKVIHWIVFPPTTVMEVTQQVAGAVEFNTHAIRRLVRYAFQIKNAGHEHIGESGKHPLTWRPPQPSPSETPAKPPVLLVANVLSWTPDTSPQPTLDYKELGSELTVKWDLFNSQDCLVIEVICDCEDEGVGNLTGQFPDVTIVQKSRRYSETADDDHRRSIRQRIWGGIWGGMGVGMAGVFLVASDKELRQLFFIDSEPYYSWVLLAVSYGITALVAYVVYHSARLGPRDK